MLRQRYSKSGNCGLSHPSPRTTARPKAFYFFHLKLPVSNSSCRHSPLCLPSTRYLRPYDPPRIHLNIPRSQLDSPTYSSIRYLQEHPFSRTNRDLSDIRRLRDIYSGIGVFSSARAYDMQFSPVLHPQHIALETFTKAIKEPQTFQYFEENGQHPKGVANDRPWEHNPRQRRGRSTGISFQVPKYVPGRYESPSELPNATATATMKQGQQLQITAITTAAMKGGDGGHGGGGDDDK